VGNANSPENVDGDVAVNVGFVKRDHLAAVLQP